MNWCEKVELSSVVELCIDEDESPLTVLEEMGEEDRSEALARDVISMTLVGREILDAEELTAGQCPHDPNGTHRAVGMYHCPICGEMVIAGMPHPQKLDQEEQDGTEVEGHDD